MPVVEDPVEVEMPSRLLKLGETEFKRFDKKPLVPPDELEELSSGSKFELSPDRCAVSRASRNARCLALAAVIVKPGAR